MHLTSRTRSGSSGCINYCCFFMFYRLDHLDFRNSYRLKTALLLMKPAGHYKGKILTSRYTLWNTWEKMQIISEGSSFSESDLIHLWVNLTTLTLDLRSQWCFQCVSNQLPLSLMAIRRIFSFFSVILVCLWKTEHVGTDRGMMQCRICHLWFTDE